MRIRSWIAAISIGLLVGNASVVLASSNNSTINVTGSVVNTSGNNDQPDTPTDNPPSISNVSLSAATSSIQASWSASDDNAVSSVTFEYGTTASYGTSAVVAGTYLTTLLNLLPNTTYFYRIVATDNNAQTAVYTGSITTQSNADTTPPVISNVQKAPGVGSCSITWDVNELALGEVSYGLTAQYGSTQASNEGSATAHTANLTNLVSSSTYHFKIIATDPSGNSAATTDATCVTLRDTTPPGNPSNLTITTSTAAITLSWTNPGDADFSGVKILRKTGGSPTTPTDGTSVYIGTDQNFSDNSIASGITYYYTVFAFDTANNYSSGVLADGFIITPIVNEICGNGVDDNNNGKTDCADTACSSQPACQVPEVCNNNLDDDSDGDIDCADSQCGGASYCSLRTEVCNNAVDDDNNGAIDCADVACFAFAGCQAPTSTVFQPPSTTVSGPAKLDLGKFVFLGGNRSFVLSSAGSRVSGLAGTSFSIRINKNDVPAVPQSFKAKINGSGEYVFSLFGETYYADAVFPVVGSHSSFFEIIYGENQIDTVPFTLQSQGFGVVTGDGVPLEGATVILYDENNQPAVLGVSNRVFTNQNGTYGWSVPNGKYSVRVSKNGFYDRATPLVSVENNVVNIAIALVAKPPSLLDDVSATSTLAENATAIAKNVAENAKALAQQSVEKLQDTVKVIEEIKKDPEVQKAASQVVAPTTVSVVAVSTVGFISWGNLLPFLRLLFLQPLMLLGHGRRKGWGQVYNALNKLPVDLATIRLVQDGKIIQSKVTDKEGRYAFVANPGKYTIQVMKAGFSFPTSLLLKAVKDGRHTDLYHGEVIEVSEQGALITANIPLDPVGDFKKPVRVAWQRFGRSLQIAFSWLGLLVTIASLYISPRWYVWVLLGVHIFLFLIFRRLAVPPKVKSWGIVYDSGSKEPLGRTVARLFNAEFNKLVATQITDGAGRYYFLAGDDKYYVTYDRPQYVSEKTQVLDLTGKDAETITVDIGLSKGENPPPVEKPVPPQPPLPPAPAVLPVQPTPVAPVPSAPISPPPAPAPTLLLTDAMNNPPEPEPESTTIHLFHDDPPKGS